MNQHQKILSLLESRDQRAIEELHKSFLPLCRSIASHALSCSEDVEEIISDTFLAVWNSIPPEKPNSLSAYISRITRNLSLARRRDLTADRRDQRLSVSLTELELCLPGSDEVQPDTIVLSQTINRFLSTLSKTNRYIFIQRYYYMDTTKEIAKRIGTTDQSIRSRLLRMRTQLRTELEKEGISV
jgi:RNA polymerase sigma-70 factor (ECF subfamily)